DAAQRRESNVRATADRGESSLLRSGLRTLSPVRLRRHASRLDDRALRSGDERALCQPGELPARAAKPRVSRPRGRSRLRRGLRFRRGSWRADSAAGLEGHPLPPAMTLLLTLLALLAALAWTTVTGWSLARLFT